MIVGDRVQAGKVLGMRRELQHPTLQSLIFN